MEIVKFGSPILKARCSHVEYGDTTAVELIEEMLKTMYESNGVGLAAPQVGVTKRIVVIDLRQPGMLFKMINPVISWKSDEMGEFTEGCLSIPHIYEKVKRPSSVSVEYLNEKFEPCLIEHAVGLLASCLQHELDHLDGKLYIDRLSRLKRARTITKYKKLQEQESMEENNEE